MHPLQALFEFTVHVKDDQYMRVINQNIKGRSLMLPWMQKKDLISFKCAADDTTLDLLEIQYLKEIIPKLATPL